MCSLQYLFKGLTSNLCAVCSAGPSALPVSKFPSNMEGSELSRSFTSSLLSCMFTNNPSGKGRNTSEADTAVDLLHRMDRVNWNHATFKTPFRLQNNVQDHGLQVRKTAILLVNYTMLTTGYQRHAITLETKQVFYRCLIMNSSYMIIARFDSDENCNKKSL